jgi:tetratricopeptide (TPR) repeat protein
MQRRTHSISSKLAAALLAAGAALSWSAASHGEPVTDRILSGYQIMPGEKCTLFKINFNVRIRYVSHFPGSGKQLRILFHPIDPRQFIAESGGMREALRPPADPRYGIRAIQYEAAIAEGPSLTIVFDRPVNFDAGGGADFQSLVFSMSEVKNGKPCKPVFPGQANGWAANSTWGETVVGRRPPASETVVGKRTPGPAPAPVVIPDVPETKIAAAPPPATAPAPAQAPAAPVKVTGPTSVTGAGAVSGPAVTGPTEVVAGGAGQEAAAGTLISEARSALRQNNYQAAISHLRKAVQLAENRRSPEARELLGVAYQKDKQVAAAKAVYEDYVRRYPNGEGTEGVRQRLLAIETAGAPLSQGLRMASNGGSNGNALVTGPTSLGGSEAPGGTTVAAKSNATVTASISSFYIRDDSASVNRDMTQAANLSKTAEDYQTHQNTVMSSFDTSATWGDGNVKMKFRFSGTDEYRVETGQELFGVSALYLDTSVKDWDSSFRIGRQTSNNYGIQGRFDGAIYNYQYNPMIGFATFGGSPVMYRTDTPFMDDRYFAGGAVNFTPFKGLDTDVYFFQQMDRTLIDRQAVGTEVRYNDTTKAVFATVDYDTYFNKLDAAIFTGSWTLPDKSVMRVAADYRMSPYLTSWNALQGQPFTSMYDLLKYYTQSQITQMAVDRTATYQSATVGYSRPLTDKFQVNLDFTQAHINGTIASYNVLGTPDMGDEFYYGIQLVGTSLLTQGDLYTAAFRYSDLKESDNFSVDLSTRYPIVDDLRIQPRVTATYSTGKGSSWEEYSVLPALVLDYTWQRDLNLELEVGERWTWRNQGSSRITENELLITAGVRYDFSADMSKCLTPSAFCREAPAAAK